jgi:DNA-directed RNA polymerase specialized sigma subunit
MTAREYLSRAYKIDRRVDAYLDEIQQLRAMAERSTGTYSATRHGGTPQRSKVETALVRIDELERLVNANIDDLVSAKQEIHDAIKRVDKPEERMLLQLRYLNGKKWEEIAVEMNYSWQHTHKIHAKALDKIKDAIQCDTFV